MTIIAFDGSQTIANVEVALARLRDGMALGEAVDIDLLAVTEADLAFVQLLIASKKSAASLGCGLRCLGTADGPVTEVLCRAGLTGAGLIEEPAAKGVSQ